MLLSRCGFVVLTVLLALHGSTGAQAQSISAIDELMEIMSGDSSLALAKVTELPSRLQGKLMAVAEFDEQQQKWAPTDGPQDFGRITVDRISVLGYEAGEEGFVEARYVQLTDRRVVSYTALTRDRRMSINIYDDENDTDHIVLQVRIGPHKLQYLMRRPSQTSH